MMLLGGGVRGGQVFARWPGLEDTQLEPPGDLRSTTDYRDVLAEVLATRLHNSRSENVFLGISHVSVVSDGLNLKAGSGALI
jgi:uncharacterized protein (DUF1501 family)